MAGGALNGECAADETGGENGDCTVCEKGDNCPPKPDCWLNGDGTFGVLGDGMLLLGEGNTFGEGRLGVPGLC